MYCEERNDKFSSSVRYNSSCFSHHFCDRNCFSDSLIAISGPAIMPIKVMVICETPIQCSGFMLTTMITYHSPSGHPTSRTSDTRKSSPGATAPPACRLRVGVPVKWSRADAPGCRRPPPSAHPHPHAGGPRRRAAGAGTGGGRRDGRPGNGRRERVMPPSPGTRKHRPAQPLHGRAGRASASR
jgi:hypothetical protein